MAAARGARAARRAGAGRRGGAPGRRGGRRCGPVASRSRCRPARCWGCRRAPPGSTVSCPRQDRRRRGPNATGRSTGRPGGDVALGALLRDRFGDELADRLADPLLGGVYAGRVDALGLRATVPALAAALDAGAPVGDRGRRPGHRRHPPRVLASVHGELRVPAQPPVFGALRGGYADARRRPRAGVDVRLSTTVRALHRLAGGWRLVLGPDQDDLDVDAVVLAVPAPAVARLLAEVVPDRRPRGGGDRTGVVRRRRAGLPGGRRDEAAGDVRRAGRGG